MKVITGRWAELRLYLCYVASVFRPGVRVPTFGAPAEFTTSLDSVGDDDLKILIEEGRRTLDQQEADLERIRSRAVPLLTVGLAETAVLSALAVRAFHHGALATVAWCLAAVAIVLAIGGAASVLTAQARMGRVDPRHVATCPPPLLRAAAHDYLQSLGEGEETVRTRLTVLRDAVLTESLAALFLALTWPFTL